MAPTPPPYKSHPIYGLRKIEIIAACIGIICNIPTCGPWDSGTGVSSVVLLIASVLFCVYDLIEWAKKSKDQEGEAEWPSKWIMLGDGVLAVALQVVAWLSLAFYRSWYGPPEFAVAYGALAAFVCSLLHGYALWKEWSAIHKKSWLASLPPQHCERCGWVNHVTAADVEARLPSHITYERPIPDASQPNMFAYAGPSATAPAAKASSSATRQPKTTVAPESTDSSMEEGLLVGSEYGSGYGSIAEEPKLEQPKEVVVGKAKEKKAKKSKGKQTAHE